MCLPKSIHLIVHHICICWRVYRHTHTHTPRRTKCSSEEELLDETEGNYIQLSLRSSDVKWTIEKWMQNPLDNESNDEHNPTEDSISLTCWNNQLSVICALSDNSSNKIIVLSMISEHLQWVDRKYCEQIGETQSQEAQNPQLLIWQNPGKSVNPDCQQANLYILLLLSHFRRVWLCVTPQTAAHQAPPSLGFSRQEHWSGSPFPSPMHESEKWKWSRSVVSDS